jgi:hypothetical protein
MALKQARIRFFPTCLRLFPAEQRAWPPHARLPSSQAARARAAPMTRESDMTFATRLLLVLALLGAPLCAPAHAADYETGASLVCDTQGQVERFVALFSGDAQAAIEVVNAEAKDPTACAIMNVAYMRGAQLGTARHGVNAFEIVRILVLGVETTDGLRAVRPAAYFSLIGIKEYAV